jgi:hypothetical protein
MAAHLLSSIKKRYATFFVHCSLVPPFCSLLAIGASDAISFSDFLADPFAIQNRRLHTRCSFQTDRGCFAIPIQDHQSHLSFLFRT